MIGRFGILAISLGLVLLTAASGTTTQLVGLGLWWFGVLLVLDLLLGGGRTTTFLWALGAALVYSAGWTSMVTGGFGRLVVGALSVLLVVPTLVRSTQRSRRTEAPRHTADGQLRAALACWEVGLRWDADPPWLVGSGGLLSFTRERKRFRQAVLPSCAGLSPDDEMRQLAQESVLMYTELCQAVPGYEPDRDEAKDILAMIQA